MKNIIKKLTSLLLCLGMILPSVFLSLPTAAAAIESPTDEEAALISEGKEAVSTTDTFTKEGVDYTITRTTQYIGARTYSVRYDISSSVTTQQSAQVRSSAHNGYFTVEQSGWYLLELWGGSGAEGSLTSFYILGLPLPVNNPGGDGGNRGYTYAKVWLEAGQTLVYSIGTNGTQTLSTDESAGGQNGDGGVHGETGNKYVGTGGGYSAIYIFNDGEFKEEWVSETSVDIPEDIRLSRYVMIAGGGGGGGAGPGNILWNTDSGRPDGGSGGNVENGYSSALLGSEYAVQGYVFSGSNGRSSGSSTNYVGKGGTSRPGAAVKSLFNATQNSSQSGNDWTGLYREGDPGAGGSGNLCGGGGGAGYAGGSGGTMEGEGLPTGIGGGGGGSSFIAATVNGKEVQFENFDENDRALEYISGVNGQSLGKNVGGCLEITYLGSGDNTVNESELDLEKLANITFSTQINRYFYVVNQGDFSSVTTNSSTGLVTLTLKGLSIMPNTIGANSGDVASFYIYLRARDEFAGGNCVDMVPRVTVDGNVVSSAHIELDDPQGDGKISFYASADKKQDFVNVEPDFVIKTNSYSTAIAGKEYERTSLYEDSYSSVRGSLSSYWQYDYIASISSYRVYDEQGNQISTSVVAAGQEGTTRLLPVQYTVTLTHVQDSEIVVGPAYNNEIKYTKNATLTVVVPNQGYLNGVEVIATKTLDYSDGKYTFAVDISQKSSEIEFPYSTINKTSGTNVSWEAPIDGWYYVQVWGAGGGKAGNVNIDQTIDSYDYTASGGSGASGGYVTGYVYLKANDTLVYTVGTAGKNTNSYTVDMRGTTLTRKGDYSVGADGGTASSVRLGTSDIPFIVAGGGGGGGGAAAVAKSNGAKDLGTGGSAAKNTTIYTTNYSSRTFNGTKGSNGSTTISGAYLTGPFDANGGGAGTSGSSYRDTAYAVGYDATGGGRVPSVDAVAYAGNLSSAYPSASGSGNPGRVSITLLESESAEAEKQNLQGLELSMAFSRYFDIDATSIELDGIKYNSSSRVNNGDGTYTVTYNRTGLKDENGDGQINSSDVTRVAYFTYEVVTAADGVSTLINIRDSGYTVNMVKLKKNGVEYIQYVANPVITVELTPKEGFLGGNDVPVLVHDMIDDPRYNPETEDEGVRIFQGEDVLDLAQSGASDYANVEIEYDFKDIFSVNNLTVRYGDTVNKSDLYTYEMPVYAPDDWRDDFVDILPIPDESYNPKVTTEYTISPYISPKAEAELAVVVESVKEVGYPMVSTVFVELPITYDLQNLTSDGTQWVLYNNGFEFTVSKASGYLLPESIELVYNDDTALADNYWSYDKDTGKVTVHAAAVVKPITVRAEGVPQTFSIHYSYVIYDSDTGEDVKQEERIVSGLLPGDVIDYSWMNEMTELINSSYAKTGHTFMWAFDSDDGTAPQTMPANDLWVYGAYAKNRYTLTVNYVCDGEATPPETVVLEHVEYGTEYSIPSPVINGYLPDIEIVSGTIPDRDTVITVTYTPSSNVLVVLYIGPQDKLMGREEYTMYTDQEYSFASKVFEGYTCSPEYIEGKMSGDNSSIVYVYCTPKNYTVSFIYKFGIYADATMNGVEEILVEYDNKYGYSPESDYFEGLPEPELTGYDFAGWYLDAEYTMPINESDIVSIAEDHILYAKWEAAKFKLVVKYVFIYEDGDFLPEGYASAQEIRDELDALARTQSIEVQYGTNYSIAIKPYVGYTAYIRYGLTGENGEQAVSGTYSEAMPGQNKIVTITYAINVYTVTFMDLSNTYTYYNDAPDDQSESIEMAYDRENWGETVWQTVEVKHNVAPVYSNSEPTHEARDAYSYSFTGWQSSDAGDDGEYEDVYSEFPVAVADVDYYAMYGAREVIVLATGTDLETGYFYSITDAVRYAEENIEKEVTLKFRRNSGNGMIIVGDNYITETEAIMEFGSIYTQTTDYTVTIDLNGYTVESREGRTIISNVPETASATISITVKDSVGDGRLYTHTADAEKNVVAIDTDSRELIISSAIEIIAKSEDGSAIAINIASNASTTHNISANAKISAIAKEDAIGIYLADQSYSNTLSSASTYAPSISANGRIAYGVSSYAYGAISNYYGSIAVSGTDEAYGIYNLPGVSLGNAAKITVEAQADGAIACGLSGMTSGTVSGADFEVTAENGTAYGMIIDKTYSISGIKLTVTGKDATGISVFGGATATLNNSLFEAKILGTDSAIGIDISEDGSLDYALTVSTSIDVEASDGYAYGIFNKGNILGMGFDLDVKAATDSYGIYNLGGSIEVSGVKGTLDVVARSDFRGEGDKAIGLFNEGGIIGEEGDTTDTSLRSGVFAGDTYGIYSGSDGTIYVSGNDLFFKGADKDSALAGEGIVIFTDYLIAPANSPREGYYRLGIERTITFVSNGGSEVAQIKQIYDTPLVMPDDPTRMGYDFVTWHDEENLSSAFVNSGFMLNEDVILYAEWDIIEYKYRYADELEQYTVILYKNTSSSDETVLHEIDVYKDLVSGDIPDPTYASGKTLYAFMGWYTQRSATASGSQRVELNGNLMQYADSDNVVRLYACWGTRTDMGAYNPLSTDPNPEGFSLTSSYTSSNYYYMYYTVPKDGNYKVNVCNLAASSSSSYRKYLHYGYLRNGSLTYSSTTTNYVTSKTYTTYSLSSLKAGDVILLRFYKYSSYTYTTQIFAYISSTPTGIVSPEDMYLYSGDLPLTYTVEDGALDLERPTKSGYQFIGWAEHKNAVEGDYIITQLKPEMLSSNAKWINRDILDLYSAWEEQTWSGVSSNGRVWDIPNATPPQAELAIRDDSHVTLYFSTEYDVEEDSVFTFAHGVPAGTVLTLIDRSGNVPVFYVYTVPDGEMLKEIAANQFAKVGDVSDTPETFSGRSDSIVLQINYCAAQFDELDHTEGERIEHVGIRVDNLTPEVEISYNLIDSTTIEVVKSEASFDYETEHSVVLDGIQITEPLDALSMGLDPSDRLFIVIRWTDLSMAPGVTFKIGEIEAVLYSDNCALIDLNATLESFTGSITVTYILNTMMQNEFEDVIFTYEVFALPEELVESALAEDTFRIYGAKPLYRCSQSTTLVQTPPLNVDNASVNRVERGDLLTIGGLTVPDGDYANLELYVYAIDENGELAVTDECLRIFDEQSGYSVSESGAVVRDDGTALVSGDAFEADIAQDATVGKYYFMFVYGNKHVYAAVRISKTQ